MRLRDSKNLCTFAPQNRTVATDSMKKCVFHIGFLVILMLCSSCVSRGVREAQEVVAQADSLWHDGQMYGVDAGDSATLAQAYETLDKSTAFCRRIREIFPFALHTSSLGTYSHACYHYGRLLREKDDPVAAMEVFINATHSHTDDLHILGRVYSNMGDICHLAGDYSLSSNMYDYCAQKYLANGDTLLFYYGLYRMAYEAAVLKNEKQTFELLDSICHYKEPMVTFLAMEAEACLYQRLEKYDTALMVIDTILSQGYADENLYLMKARCHEHLSQNDSALIYAQKVIDIGNQDNSYAVDAYYILAYSDSTLSADSLLAITSRRADAQKAWANTKGKLTKAVQVLEQDLHPKPNWNWLYAIIGTLFLVSLIIWLYISYKKRCHQLLSQSIRLEQNKKKHIEGELHSMKEEYDSLTKNKHDEIELACDTLRSSSNMKNDLCWKDYTQFCDVINTNFFFLANKLKQTNVLSEREIRMCVLVLVNVSSKQVADMLPYAENSVGTLKDRVAKKLGTSGKNLRSFLIKMAVGRSL